MKILHHSGLTKSYWFAKNIFEQMANIGAEVGRAINWRKKDAKTANFAFERALELFDLTTADPKNKNRLKEICRLREAFVDFFLYDNIYHTTEKFWHNYFYSFNYAARVGLVE